MKKIFIFLDGKTVQADQNVLDSLMPGVMNHQGVFETMLVYKGSIFVLEEHLSRLKRGLKVYGFKSPYAFKAIKSYLCKMIEKNHLVHGRMRLSIWEEKKKMHIAIVGQNISPLSEKDYQQGFKVILSEERRVRTKFSHIKSLDYKVFRRAFLAAKECGYDEALLLNNRREVVEGAITNIFFIQNGVVLTPAVRCGCLNGITRNIVLRLARADGMSCQMMHGQMEPLLKAEEVFVTNSFLGIMSVTHIGQKKIG
ncbi:Aminodeoxychorismate lyase, partial [hydrothermal vent metagenome]